MLILMYIHRLYELLFQLTALLLCLTHVCMERVMCGVPYTYQTLPHYLVVLASIMPQSLSVLCHEFDENSLTWIFANKRPRNRDVLQLGSLIL